MTQPTHHGGIGLAILICQMKRREIPRDPLYQSGFTDHDIDRKSIEVLLIETLGAWRGAYYAEHGTIR